jgi:hypothetical protein
MPGFPDPLHPSGSPNTSRHGDEQRQAPREQIFMAVHSGFGGRLGLAWYDSSTAEVGKQQLLKALLYF